jgi:ribonucleoside-diphosphate reductase alpha chain
MYTNTAIKLVENQNEQKDNKKTQGNIKSMTSYSVVTDTSRDELLSDFGRATLRDRYLLEGENYQDMFARVACAYADDQEHAQRVYDYMSKLWFTPATPILSNGGTTRGLPISCFLNETQDSLEGIVDLWNENVWLAARGGGIGSYWGNLRSIGEKVRGNGKTSGVIPFMRVQDSLTLAISQGSLRRGSSAVYMPIWHPEIEEFIDIRRPTGGDPNRKALNIHHGVVISDAFMEAVEQDAEWDLLSPKTNEPVQTVKARDLWIKLLITRMETGEPYMLFIDNVNKFIPDHHKQLGLNVKTSNLCSEITLPTGPDHLGNERTAVCCLSSLNLETYDEWKSDDRFIEDVMRLLDNILQSFIDTAPKEMARAAYSAMRERSVGLGVMGFHSYLQAKNVPFESVMAKVWNKQMFEHIRKGADAASLALGLERGPCPDAAEVGSMERFSNKMAIAPTASISIIGGNSSPGIEPYAANVFVQKTLSGSFTVRNKHLDKLLTEKGMNNDDIWASISSSEGSVQHLDFLDEHEKLTFTTAQEIDQRWVIEHAADRTQYICQAQSVNLFLAPDINKRDLHLLHYSAWKKGMKSLYYCRSTSMQRSDKVSHKVEADSPALQLEMSLIKKQAAISGAMHANAGQSSKYDECLACQ